MCAPYDIDEGFYQMPDRKEEHSLESIDKEIAMDEYVEYEIEDRRYQEDWDNFIDALDILGIQRR